MGTFRFVGQFLSKNQRNEANGGPYRKFTNVFVKNFGDNLLDDGLREMFEKYGDITSAVVSDLFLLNFGDQVKLSIEFICLVVGDKKTGCKR